MMPRELVLPLGVLALSLGLVLAGRLELGRLGPAPETTVAPIVRPTPGTAVAVSAPAVGVADAVPPPASSALDEARLAVGLAREFEELGAGGAWAARALAELGLGGGGGRP